MTKLIDDLKSLLIEQPWSDDPPEEWDLVVLYRPVKLLDIVVPAMSTAKAVSDE